MYRTRFLMASIAAMVLTSSLVAYAGSERVLHRFAPLGGEDPQAGLAVDASGTLYGTTATGGQGTCQNNGGCGTVFQLTLGQDGIWHQTQLYAFTGGKDGGTPVAGLALDAEGNLYGTTQYGGEGDTICGGGCGTVFELTRNSKGHWTEKVIHYFTGFRDGANPVTPLVFDTSGNLFGNTYNGGDETCGCGVVFELAPNSTGVWKETVLHTFVRNKTGQMPGGGFPSGGLTFDSAGNLYGTVTAGGGDRLGAIFCMQPSAGGRWKYSVLHTFEQYGGDGNRPTGQLAFDSSGNLYGITPNGGDYGVGTVFRLEPGYGGRWTYTILYSFTGYYQQHDGANPMGGLTFRNGNLFGTTRNSNGQAEGTVFELTVGSDGKWAESNLYFFQGVNDGAASYAAVVFDSNGNMFGTTSAGGGPNCNCGTVFELIPSGNSWTEDIIFRFPGVDGQIPSDVILDNAGNLYGTTEYGGQYGFGTVFKQTPLMDHKWKYEIIHNFSGADDGANPAAGLVLDANGNLYGTASQGGNGFGTVFELTPVPGNKWTETTLYSFIGGTDGAYPQASLVFDSVGNLYGTTYWNGEYGGGVVFQLSPTSEGWTESVLTTFDQNTNLRTGLAIDSSGALYGTTDEGWGVVYQLKKSRGTWVTSVLYSFRGQEDGGYPSSGLTLDSEGNLYGSTSQGGSSCNCGVIFELKRSRHWKEVVLHAFSGQADGTQPIGTLVFGQDGNLYGATSGGGAAGCRCGVVFRELKPSAMPIWTEETLLALPGGVGGSYPASGVAIDQFGNIYGTTSAGGRKGSNGSGYGVVFEVRP